MENNEPAVLVIVQARTDSTRLPAKALLPIGALPSAVLAVKRAGNRGHSVILATSDRPTDDLLAATAESAGVNVFRGSAEDVLGRYVAASKDLEDDDFLVRLTADNVLPDGTLIEELVAAVRTAGQPYLNTEQAWGKCPYGLSAEVMLVGALRRAAQEADSAFDREHVTPLIRKTVSVEPKELRFSSSEQAIRCTVDTLDDYLRVSRCFRKVQDPTSVGWRTLLENLVEAPDSPKPIAPGPQLVLGTAQLAAAYGSSVKVVPPKVDEAVELVREAIHRGAIAVDTARSYAGSETVLGRALSEGWNSRVKVITKLSPLADLPVDIAAHLAATAAEISVLKSLHALGCIKPWLLLHRAAHLKAWDGAVWSRLQELQLEGLIAGLGVSVQSPDELAAALAVSDVQIIQLPFNLLDCRWIKAGAAERLAARPDVEVHVRSVFLQGLLLRDPSEWPTVPHLDATAVHRAMNDLVAKLCRENIADLCLAYVRSVPWIDGVVIGMERKSQLAENAALFGNPPLTADDAELVWSSLPSVPETFLNPATWPQTIQNCNSLGR